MTRAEGIINDWRTAISELLRWRTQLNALQQEHTDAGMDAQWDALPDSTFTTLGVSRQQMKDATVSAGVATQFPAADRAKLNRVRL